MKMKVSKLPPMTAALGLALVLAGCSGFLFTDPPTSPPITWTATADSTIFTTAINFDFGGHSLSGLTASHITVTDGTGSVISGTLTWQSSSRQWLLAVTILEPGDVSISIDFQLPNSRWVDSEPRQVQVHAQYIAWTATVDCTIFTTAIDFNFHGFGPQLTTSHITVTGSVITGALTGSGSFRRLAITTMEPGSVWVSIDFQMPNSRRVDPEPRQVAVFRPPLPPTPLMATSSGWNHTVAIGADGSLWAWGANGSGQLGDGTTVNRLFPTQIQPGTTWRAVSASTQAEDGIRNVAVTGVQTCALPI